MTRFSSCMRLSEDEEESLASPAWIRYPTPAPDTAAQPGYGALDSGCGSTMVGSETIKNYEEMLAQKGLRIVYRPCSKRFRFGNDGENEASQEAVIPVALQCCRAGRSVCGLIRAAVVPGGAPLLHQQDFLQKAQLGAAQAGDYRAFS